MGARARIVLGLGLTVLLGLTLHASAGLNRWSTGGPPDESILSLAVDPLAPGTVYAGTNGDGLFRTFDGGLRWFPINVGLTNPIVAAVVVHPVDTAVVYAGTSGEGVFRSLDRGQTWAPINVGLTNAVIAALAVDPSLPNRLYAGTNGGGVFRSLDGGQRWAPVNNGLVNQVVTSLAVDPVNAGTVYAGTTGGGVFRSTNAGQFWAAANANLVNMLVSALAVDPVTPRTVYAATTGGGVFRSSSGGGAWAPINNGLLNVNTIITGLAIDPRVPTTLYASAPGTGVFRTTTAGALWQTLVSGLDNTAVNAVAVTPSGLCVHAATRGGGVFDFAFTPAACAPPTLAAAILPSSRSVLVGAAASAFATIINPGTVAATGCRIDLLDAVPATLSFQTTDPATNVVTGTPDTAVTIGPGALQTFVITITSAVPIAAADLRFNFNCANTASARVIPGVNTFLLSASNTQPPDVVALAAADAGIVNVPGPTGTGAFAVATINVGAGDQITVSADTGAVPLPVTLAVCETNGAGGCAAPPTASVTRAIDPAATPTFGIFVTAATAIGFDPAVNRVFVRFRDPSGQTRGSTSVAVRTQ